MKPLVTVPLIGGLGNQMFEIATAYAYARREGGKLLLQYINHCGKRPVYWDSFFASFASQLVSGLPHLPVWREVNATTYTPLPPLTAAGLRLDGYLQSSKYFADAAEEIRERFQAPRSLQDAVEEKYAELLSQRERVVVVHARRTDYLQHMEVHSPVGVEYYRESVRRVRNTVNNPLFLLVSDDPSFWRSELPDLEGTILDDATDVETMILLQRFQYFVMSNSTFIWWATWLAKPQHVWVPARWFGPKGPREWEDIYEAEWERIN